MTSQRVPSMPLSVPLTARNRPEVNILVMNAEAQVLLCSQANGWVLPGGEVLPGEAAEHALSRTLHASTGLEAHTPFLLTLISGPDTYAKLGSGEEVFDFTAVYVVREWAGETDSQARFFALDHLPDGLCTKDQRALNELRCCWGIC